MLLIGIAVNTIPTMRATSNPDHSYWYTLPLFLSTLPVALSGITQETVLRDVVGARELPLAHTRGAASQWLVMSRSACHCAIRACAHG